MGSFSLERGFLRVLVVVMRAAEVTSTTASFDGTVLALPVEETLALLLDLRLVLPFQAMVRRYSRCCRVRARRQFGETEAGN